MFRSDRFPRPWTLSGPLPPPRIETPRLVLRCWEPADAPCFHSALRASREHIGAWIAVVRDEPSELAAIRGRLARFRSEFHAGVGFVYALLDRSGTEVLGEAGLMPRLGPGTLEIGYWIHTDHVGRGLATEATRVLTRAGLALPEVQRIEIHCDPANAPSAAVPRKLGYRLVPPRDGELEDSLVFVAEAGDRGDALVHPMEEIADAMGEAWYHGTRTRYEAGQTIPSRVRTGGDPDSTGVHLSRDLDGAIWGAELAPGEGPSRVYRVETPGPVERREACPPHPSMAWRSSGEVRVVEEVMDWPLYHGTRASLRVGDVIVPGRLSNFGDPGRVAGHVYMTRTLDAAKWGAELAAGDGPGRIYLVEPLGAIEDDPNLTDKKFRGNPTKSFRSKEPLRVTGEVENWEGHPPEAIRAMREGLQRLKERGEDVIDD